MPAMKLSCINYYSWEWKNKENNELQLENQNNLPLIRGCAKLTKIHNMTWAGKLKIEDELLIVLMKLRLGSSNFDLAKRFQFKTTVVSTIFTTWIKLMYRNFNPVDWWPHRKELLSRMNYQFRHFYGNVMAIVGCAKVSLELSFASNTNEETNSKATEQSLSKTFKCLIALDSRGLIIYVSRLFNQEVSDAEIWKSSGFLNTLDQLLRLSRLLPDDALMADIGFTIEADCQDRGLGVAVPHFFHDTKSLPYYPDGVRYFTGTSIELPKFQLERAVEKVKSFFQILKGKLSVFSYSLLDEIWTVCSLLSSIPEPL